VRNSTAALALVIATTSSMACTVLNDMDSYTGGFADSGEEVLVDSGIRADSFVPPVDTGVKDTTGTDTKMADTALTETAVTDTGVDTTMDTGTPIDSATDTRDSATPDTMTPDAPVGCHIVINEVQTRGVVAGDEFIELYNQCDATVDLSGYRLVYRSATGVSDVTVALIPSGKSIAAKGFFVVGNGSFAAGADVPFTASGIADDGAAAIRDASGMSLDSLGWGSVASTHAFVETAAAPGPATGASISRTPAGTDTNNNSADFKNTSPSTPKS
jgi:hypothetical protein